MLYSCNPASGEPTVVGGRSGRASGSHRRFAVDLHCHVFVPEAHALVGDAFEMEMEASVQANAMELLSKVNKALGKMEDGTYGICEVSGDPIPVARLEALPYATTTVENAGKI